uniref:NADH-plastoquinone oxidoreductase subunit J n=1 Tax=Pteris arisanensis TaxID=1508565 RepID=UPI002A807F2E|nr:NADH-plastoquinone oxidoreductase subunit J [Pteris arisanensis]WNR49020.1 NADH-plastoquinone oxidoreductase subunit J [Pteris arisanensis]
MNTTEKDEFHPDTRGRISAWLAKHKFSHRPLGYDYRGVEILQVKSEEWLSIAVALYAYGFNYLRCQCAYDATPGGFLVSVYHLTQMRDQPDQPEEICAKVFVSRENPQIPSVYWVWKSADFQERESYDMLGIIHRGHPYLRRILMPESWIGWPLRKDYVVPNFYELQDAY